MQWRRRKKKERKEDGDYQWRRKPSPFYHLRKDSSSGSHIRNGKESYISPWLKLFGLEWYSKVKIVSLVSADEKRKEFDGNHLVLTEGSNKMGIFLSIHPHLGKEEPIYVIVPAGNKGV